MMQVISKFLAKLPEKPRKTKLKRFFTWQMTPHYVGGLLAGRSYHGWETFVVVSKIVITDRQLIIDQLKENGYPSIKLLEGVTHPYAMGLVIHATLISGFKCQKFEETVTKLIERV